MLNTESLKKSFLPQNIRLLCGIIFLNGKNFYTVETEKKNVKQICQQLIEILNQASGLEERFTAIKLMDAYQGKKVGGFRVSGLSLAPVTRDVLERIIALMLIKGYLREDFHFTAYTTISYLLPGTTCGCCF